MLSVIQNHNTKLLKDPTAPTVKECSCRQKSNCPRRRISNKRMTQIVISTISHFWSPTLTTF